MNIPTGIDADAPVIGRHQIDINAPDRQRQSKSL
jgi:hypothetical protein